MTGVNNKFFATMLANTENGFIFTHGYSSLCAFCSVNLKLQEEYPFLLKSQEAKKLPYESPGKNIWSKNTLYVFKSEEKAERRL